MTEPTDDPATTVYGRLLHRHMKAARRFGVPSPEQEAAFALVETFRAAFPSECQVWEDRYADR